MKAIRTLKTTKKRAAELARLAALPDRDIDTSDMPETSGWSKAVVGKFYRPVKTQVTLRIDADVLQLVQNTRRKIPVGRQRRLARACGAEVEEGGKVSGRVR